MSRPTPRIVRRDEPPKKRWWLYLGGTTLWISILVHVLFIGGAAYIIVEHFSKKHVNFVATAPPEPHNEVEHKIQVAKKNSVESAPPDLKRITTTDVSPITVPDVPEPPKVDDATPSTMSGSGNMGDGMGSGTGTGGSGTGGGIPIFGSAGGVGLEGTLYDLKQTPDRKPTNIAATGAELNGGFGLKGWDKLPAMVEAIRVLRSFAKEWDMDILNKYYKAPVKLVATQIFIPKIWASEAPKAFQAQDTVEPRRWVVHYHGKIIPPRSGEFRFIGFGDDYLMVRIGTRTVLDGSEPDQRLDPDANNSNDDVGYAPAYTGKVKLACGRWVQMTAGEPLDIQILIGEGPGGFSSFYLMLDELDAKNPKGNYPVFQLKEIGLPSWEKSEDVPPAFTSKKILFGIGSDDGLSEGN